MKVLRLVGRDQIQLMVRVDTNKLAQQSERLAWILDEVFKRDHVNLVITELRSPRLQLLTA